MNTPCRPALLAPLALAGVLAAQAARASDVHVYEWHEPNGVTSFSQSRPPADAGSVSSREITVPSLTPAQRVAVRGYLAALDRRQLADAERFRKRVSQADAAIQAATRALAERERALETGRVPRPGERVGDINGGSRLRLEYFERQRDLEQSVHEARRQLAEAFKARDALVE